MEELIIVFDLESIEIIEILDSYDERIDRLFGEDYLVQVLELSVLEESLLRESYSIFITFVESNRQLLSVKLSFSETESFSIHDQMSDLVLDDANVHTLEFLTMDIQ